MTNSLIFVDSEKNYNAYKHHVQDSSTLIDISDIFGEGGSDYIAHLYNGDLASLLQTFASQLQSHKTAIQNSDSVFYATSPDFVGDAIASLLTNFFEIKNGAVHRLRISSMSAKSLNQSLPQRKKTATAANALDKFIALDKVFDAHVRPLLKIGENSLPVFGLASAVALDLVCRVQNKFDATAKVQHTIKGIFAYKNIELAADLVKVKNQPPSIKDKHVAKGILIDIKEQKFKISGIRSKENKKAPKKPKTNIDNVM